MFDKVLTLKELNTRLSNVLWRSLFLGIYPFKINNENITRCEICSKLTIKTLEGRQWHHSGVFIVNFGQISHIILGFPLMLICRQDMPVNPGWVFLRHHIVVWRFFEHECLRCIEIDSERIKIITFAESVALTAIRKYLKKTY